MITLTPIAAQHIRASAEKGDIEDLMLRLAARIAEDGSIEYAMGFDDRGAQDIVVTCEGIDLLIYENQRELLEGATLDFVETPTPSFVFRNPNAPHNNCGGGTCGGGKGGCSSSSGSSCA